jgi:uncharacterized protein YjbI with pentapeptide repeats/cell wall assembly regulator SMI1
MPHPRLLTLDTLTEASHAGIEPVWTPPAARARDELAEMDMTHERIPTNVMDAWKKIQEAVTLLDPDESISLPAGASEEDLKRVENEIGVRLPEAFRQSYLLHNGSNRVQVCPNAFFLPLTTTEGLFGWGILEAWRAMCEIGEEFKDERSHPNGPIRSVYWHPSWIPFADNEGGDYVCLDFAPEKGGAIGQVIDWGHELGPERVLAPSFAEWLLRLPSDLTAFRDANRERESREAQEARRRFSPSGCWGPAKLHGKTFCFAGNLRRWQPAQAVERVKAEGGQVADRVTTKLDYLVVGELKSDRLPDPKKEANELNAKGAKIVILDEPQFSELFSPTLEELRGVLLRRPDRDRWSWLIGGSCRVIPLPDCLSLDFRKANLSGLDLFSLNLTAADLRYAKLDHAAFNSRGGKLDGASLVDSLPRELMNSSLRYADLSECNLNTANLDGADLTHAKLRKCHGPYWRAVGATFHRADLTECCLEGCNLQGADFSKANLTRADLTGSDLTGCNLSQASLESADLTGARLAGVRLSKANLRRANLACVDLTGATIDAADFAKANLSGARTDGLDVGKALSFPHKQQLVGQVGPSIRQFAAVASETKDLEVLAQFSLQGGNLVVQFHAGTFGANGSSATKGVPGYGDRGSLFPREHATVEQCMVYLAHRWNGAKLDTGSIKVKAKACPLDNAELKTVAIAAFLEAFGE